MIVLTWLGSGFAFAIGIACGAWMMRAVSKEEHADSKSRMDRSIDLIAERNEIAQHQLDCLKEILRTYHDQ